MLLVEMLRQATFDVSFLCDGSHGQINPLGCDYQAVEINIQKGSWLPKKHPQRDHRVLSETPEEWMKYFENLAEGKLNERFQEDTNRIQIEKPKKPFKTDGNILKNILSDKTKIYSFAPHKCPKHNT